MGTKKGYRYKDTPLTAIADAESVRQSIGWLYSADFWLAPSKEHDDRLVLIDFRTVYGRKIRHGIVGWLFRIYLRAGGVGFNYFQTLPCGAKVVEGGPTLDLAGDGAPECESYADALGRCEKAYQGNFGRE